VAIGATPVAQRFYRIVSFQDLMSPVKRKRDRSRFDMGHELAHLTMHQPHDAADRVAEKDAVAFAAAFLMPADDIKEEIPTKRDCDLLLQLKAKWQTSIAALFYRCRTVGLMEEDTYAQAMKTLSVRGWRKHEPGDLGEPESPMLLQRAVSATTRRHVRWS
jgi:Zn-dependent peptidase ImmA (M78 family)